MIITVNKIGKILFLIEFTVYQGTQVFRGKKSLVCVMMESLVEFR